MELDELGIGLSMNLDARLSTGRAILDQWRRDRVPVRALSKDTLADLSSLLFGQALSREELFEYRARLLRAMDVLEYLERGLEDLPDPRPEWARSGAGFHRVGPVVWVSPPEPASMAPARPRPLEEILDAYRVGTAGGTFEPRTSVHRVAVSVRVGAGRMRAGFDQVHLTRDGLAELQAPRAPVLVSRMPPSFPTRSEVMRCAA